MRRTNPCLTLALAWLQISALSGCDQGTATLDDTATIAEEKRADELPSASAHPTSTAAADSAAAGGVALPEARDRILTVLIGGFDSDPTPAQIDGTARRGTGKSGLYQLMGDLRAAGVTARYFNWNGTEAGQAAAERPPGAAGIAGWIINYHRRHPEVPLAIVGNSWGGQTALEVATLLAQRDQPVPIAHLHLNDASSLLRSFTGLPPIPDNVTSVTNYFTRHIITTGPLSDDDGRVENIDLGDPANGFLRADWGRYDATDDMRAHILAEWDPLIHADIQKRILQLAGD